MATGAAGDGMFQGVYGGCITSDDVGVQRRPYHRNCSCALHKSNGGRSCSHVAKVSYPFRRSWSEGSMVVTNSTASPGSSPSCFSSSTAAAPNSPTTSLPMDVPSIIDRECKAVAEPSSKA